MFTDMPPGPRVGFPEVLAGAKAGADWAFEALYRDLAPGVLGYLRGQRVHEAEDLAAEVFVGMVRGIGSFEGDERRFRSWVFSIAHNRIVDERRRLGRRPEALIDPAELNEAWGRGIVAEAEELLDGRIPGAVAAALLRLPPPQRTVVLLRIVADLSVAEVSRVIRKSPGAVKALQHRGLRTLAEELELESVT